MAKETGRDVKEYLIRTEYGHFIARFNNETGAWEPAFGGIGKIPERIPTGCVSAFVRLDKVFDE